MISNINVLAALILLWAEIYLIFIVKKPIDSISYSFYLFMEKKKSQYFVYYTWGVGLPLMLFSKETFVTTVPKFMQFGFEPEAQACLALAGFMLAMVGVASTYKVVATLHYAFAATAIGLGYAAIAIQWHWYVLLPLVPFGLASGFFYWKNVENKTYWTERVAQWMIFLFLIFGNMITK